MPLFRQLPKIEVFLKERRFSGVLTLFHLIFLFLGLKLVSPTTKLKVQAFLSDSLDASRNIFFEIS